MSIKLIIKNQVIILDDGKILKETLLDQGLFAESYIAILNGDIIDENTFLKDGDEVKLISAISGG